MRRLILVGAGGHAKVVAAAAIAAGDTIVGAFDDDISRAGDLMHGVPLLGTTARIAEHGDFDGAVIAIGDNRVRADMARRLDLPWVSIVHPTAWVDPSCRLGHGTVVCAGAMMQPDCRLQEHVIVNTCASVDHDCILESFVHVAPGVHLAGSVRLGSGTLMGVGSTATPGRSIGTWATIGAGAAVTTDLPDACTAVGVPARPLE